MMIPMSTTTSLMTFEEFERLPDHAEPGKLELLDGELVRMPPAETDHMEISLAIYEALRDLVRAIEARNEAGTLGRVWHETGYRIAGNWLTPDVSISHAGQPRLQYLEGAPALAVEVISKSNTADEMHLKVMCYLDNGAREVWLVYPRTRSVSIYRGKIAVEVEGTLTSELLPGVSIDLSQIFAAVR